MRYTVELDRREVVVILAALIAYAPTVEGTNDETTVENLADYLLTETGVAT